MRDPVLRDSLLTGATHNPEAAAHFAATTGAPNGGGLDPMKIEATERSSTPRATKASVPRQRALLALFETACAAAEFVLWATAVRAVVEIVGLG